MKLLKLILILPLVIILSSFISNSHSISNETAGIFSCKINGKPFIIKNMKANLRTITGGHKELSLSNDKFSTFIFINPSKKNIDLGSNNREAYVRFVEPGIHELFKPQNGIIKIEKLDEVELILSGVFEMEMALKNNPSKKIKITEGKLINIPIEEEIK